ncbi:MAG: glycosyltransferase [Bacteroidales bacterium]|jgi:glycosyltransferase involved in cell wall biosynthesis|nr:glycosyltransferase [Bacteroidales bacterium]
MNKNRLISVIVPVYNGEKYIDVCMNNLLQQTYKNLEIIVIDDGSTDSSPEKLKKYSVKIFRQENKGLSAARNIGIKIATGEYIHFMDVDDLINAEFYQKLAEANAQVDADIYCAGMENEPCPHRTLLYEHLQVLSSTDDKMKITKVGRWGYVWRYLFRKSFLEKQDLHFEVGRVIEDLPFSLQAVFFADKVVTVPDATYYYKKNENSILTSPDPVAKKKRHDGWLKAKEFRQQFAKEHCIKIPGVWTGRFTKYLDQWFA